MCFKIFVPFHVKKSYNYCAKRLFRSSGPPGASVRPSSSVLRLRPHRSPKSPKNGPHETDLANSIAGRGVPFLIHFWDLTQIRQLMQSDSIILILYVDDKKKPQNGLLKASRPPPCRCCLVIVRNPAAITSIT